MMRPHRSLIVFLILVAYVYIKSRSIFVAAVAHITMNNASASFGSLFVLHNQFVANLATALVMVVVVLLLYTTGQLQVFHNLGKAEYDGIGTTPAGADTVGPKAYSAHEEDSC